MDNMCLVLKKDLSCEFQDFKNLDGVCVALCNGCYPNLDTQAKVLAAGHHILDVKKWLDFYIRKMINADIPYNPYQETLFY